MLSGKDIGQNSGQRQKRDENQQPQSAVSLLFKYSLLNKKLDQNTFIGPNFTSEKAYIEDIIKSIQQHDSKILGKIQKRRGRKKFILN